MLIKYNSSYLVCEDYELWTRAVRHFEAANLKDVLVFYRKHDKQTSNVYNTVKLLNNIKVKLNQILYLVGNSSPKEIGIYKQILLKSAAINKYDYEKALQRIRFANSLKGMYNEALFDEFINQIWTMPNGDLKN